MIINTLTPSSKKYPKPLLDLEKASRPDPLYHVGADLNQLFRRPAVAIVGSRNSSIYGERVTRQLARDLAEQGVIIVSGLAIGTDGIAQRAALKAGGLCIAVLPCPIDQIVPVSNQDLAEEILAKGGALVSEYPSGQVVQKNNFIARNRLMSGLSKVVLITEAAEKSGTLHTARFAHDQNRDILAVPGNITLAGYVGANNLIKEGAGLVTSYKDVLLALGLKVHQTAARAVKGRNANEQKLLNLMLEGVDNGDELLAKSQLNLSEFNQAITMLEISGKIKPLGMNYWTIF